MQKTLRIIFAAIFVIALVIGLAMPAMTVSAQGTTAPDGFCTTAAPNNPGWQVSGTVSLPSGCPETGKWAMSMGGNVTRYQTWTEMNTARNGSKATLYFEGATASGSTPVAGQPVTAAPIAASDRILRLIELDNVYRSQGWQAWLNAAGISCTSVTVEARQPEEEIVVDTSGTSHIVVSGLQIRGQCTIPWPNVLTTDRPGEVTTDTTSRTYQPDLRNASVLYTNVKLNGQGTVYADGTNWGQLIPAGQPIPTAVSQPTQVAQPTATQQAQPTPTAVGGGGVVNPTPTSITAPSGGGQQNTGGISPWLWLLIVATAIGLIVWLLSRRAPATPPATPAATPVVTPAAAPAATPAATPVVTPAAAPAATTAATPVVTPAVYDAANLQAAVPTLSVQQAADLIAAYPTLAALKAATASQIRSAGKMGSAKAATVIAAAAAW